MRRVALWVCVASLAGACAAPAPAPPPERAVAIDDEIAGELAQRVHGFYLRLANRRFNTLETYADNIMREYFQSRDLFYDYYADLAEELDEAWFEKSRPEDVVVLAIEFEAPDRAQVRVRFHGQDGRPLRPWGTSLVRVDRWEWADGTWWVQPGKL